MTPEEREWCALVRDLRRRMGLSHVKFGKQVGAAKRTVIHWEQEAHVPGEIAKKRLLRLREVVDRGLDMQDRDEPPSWDDPEGMVKRPKFRQGVRPTAKKVRRKKKTKRVAVGRVCETLQRTLEHFLAPGLRDQVVGELKKALEPKQKAQGAPLEKGEL